jgi:Putative auto-transporter adhesin, head GIN domain
MNRLPAFTTLLILLPVTALAATRSYETGDFESVSVAAGVDAQITLGSSRSVVAETRAQDFDDLRVQVQGNVLRIDRPKGRWFFFRRPDYLVRVVTPVLRSVTASSGADVEVKGTSGGDFTVEASSGSDVSVSLVKAGKVKALASSGSDLELSGTCMTLEAETSSGSDLDAGDLKCETVALQASSGSDVSVFASRSVTGKASSGSDVQISGAPPAVQVDKSSGADVSVGK